MKKPVKKQPNSINVSEFKSWMSGVEDMQADGWVPNKQQWDRIRSKIALLSDDTADVIRVAETVDPGTPTAPIQQPPRNYVPDNYPVMDNSYSFQQPVTPSPVIGPLHPTPVQIQSGALSYVNGDLPDYL
jgi:hypothetical protein